VPRAIAARERLRRIFNIYYAAVIACIRDAESILVFWPGRSEGRIEKAAQESNLSGHIVGMETVDKMTDHQIAAKSDSIFRDNGDQRSGSRVKMSRTS